MTLQQNAVIRGEEKNIRAIHFIEKYLSYFRLSTEHCISLPN